MCGLKKVLIIFGFTVLKYYKIRLIIEKYAFTEQTGLRASKYYRNFFKSETDVLNMFSSNL